VLVGLFEKSIITRFFTMAVVTRGNLGYWWEKYITEVSFKERERVEKW
jgi:hypothetical protein